MSTFDLFDPVSMTWERIKYLIMSQILGAHNSIINLSWRVFVSEQPKCGSTDISRAHKWNLAITGRSVYLVLIFDVCEFETFREIFYLLSGILSGTES
jgi:hypothetical protein